MFGESSAAGKGILLCARKKGGFKYGRTKGKLTWGGEWIDLGRTQGMIVLECFVGCCQHADPRAIQ